MSFNNLLGNLPKSFSSCSVLELDMSNNIFSGELPVGTLVKMSNLKPWFLSFNNFDGFLRESMSTLVGLETLDVSFNNLSRVIPFGICQDS